MKPTISIKGIRDGLLVSMGDGSWTDALSALMEEIQQNSEFIQGARVTLDVGNYVLNAAEMGKLRDMLSDLGVSLQIVLSNSPTTETTAQTLGLGTRLSKPHPKRVARSLDTNVRDGQQGVFVHRTLRSGYKLEYPGHITVIGDINPGAEAIAGGCIVVWGRLRGVVHAGAEGDEQAFVCALMLSPTQLRIAEKIAVSPKQSKVFQPEIAFLRNGEVVAESWNTKSK